MKTAILIGIITLFAYSQQACGNNCVMCNSKDECLVCDFQRKYALVSSQCSLISIDHCAVVTHEGNCSDCEAGYYLESTGAKCVLIPETSKIDNCIYYDSSIACVLCDTQYYIKSGACTKAETAIDNCLYYVPSSTDTKGYICYICQPGYIFANDKVACIELKALDNCLDHSYVQCNTCKTGFIANKNLYLVNMFKTGTGAYSGILGRMQNSHSLWSGVNICQALTFDYAHCTDYKVFDECLACLKVSHYLKAKDCVANPRPPIQYCKIYTSEIKCIECNQGFFLSSSTLCKAVEPITNCSTYDGTASATKCLTCKDDYYRTNDTTCAKRVNSLSISKCLTKETTQDLCKTCDKDYVITDDKLLCLPQVGSCLTYEASTKDTTKLVCSKCVNGNYLTEGTDGTKSCTSGTVTNCLTYTTAADTCTVCNNGYFLESTTSCKAHVTIDNCKTYSQDTQNICDECSNAYYPFEKKTVCKKQTAVSNCKTYNAAGTACTACKDQYYLTATSTCASTSTTITDCIECTAPCTTCTKCKDKKVLKADGSKCFDPFSFITANCYTYPLNTGDLSKECEVCKTQYVPIKVKGTAVCLKDDQITATTQLGLALITDCAKYIYNGTTLVCAQCNTTKPLLNEAKAACGTACTTATSHVILDDLYGYRNVCANVILTNAYHIVRIVRSADYTTPGDFNIASYDTTLYNPFYTASTILQDNNIAMPYNPIPTTTKTVNAFKTLTFGLQISLIAKSTANTILFELATGSNACELYIIIGGKYLCARCIFGSSLLTVVDTPATTNLALKCVAITDCNSTMKYLNIPSFASALLSCYTCNNSKLVQTFVHASNANTFVSPYYDATATGATNVTVCDTIANIIAVSTITAIANCKIYVSLLKDTDDSDLGTFCLVCEPGYKMTYVVAAKFYGSACTAITNAVAQTSTTEQVANGTASCADAADATKKFAFADYNQDECVVVTTSNCYIAGTTPDCAVCKAGYFLNEDKLCEEYITPNCSAKASNYSPFVFTPDSTTIRNYYEVNSGAIGTYGCDTCSTGYTNIIWNTTGERYVCIKSEVQLDSTLLTASNTANNYIDHCDRYRMHASDNTTVTQFRCSVCKTGYVVLADYTKCQVTSTNLTNCVEASTTTNTDCATCVDTKHLVSGACKDKSITNCKTYLAGQTTLQCSVCDSGYSLSTDKLKCTSGTVDMCATYTDGKTDECLTCKDDYFLHVDNNSIYYCYPIDSSTFCTTLDAGATGTQAKNFTCSACKQVTDIYGTDTWVADATLSSSYCMHVYNIENCKTYYTDKYDDMKNNSFLCEYCNDGYYFNNTTRRCVERVNKSSYCGTYDQFADKCKVCKDYYYLDNADKECTHYPTGIYKCLEYIDAAICSKCDQHYYLSDDNTECLKTTTEVDNCLVYSADKTCSVCMADYFLANNTCSAATASNCYTFESISKCATCSPAKPYKYGLKTENGVTSCVDKSIASCALYTTDATTFACDYCDTGYYLDSTSGACTGVEITIENCEIYENKNQCKKCAAGYFLNTTKKSCDINAKISVDSNCEDLVQLTAPICSQCKETFVFTSGVCQQCSNNSTCFQCNSVDTTVCDICQTGYQMDAAGNCTVSATGESTASTSIISILASLFLFIFGFM